VWFLAWFLDRKFPREVLFGGRIKVYTPSEFIAMDFLDFEGHAAKETPIVVARHVEQYLRDIGFI
jgi:hypothetical protein